MTERAVSLTIGSHYLAFSSKRKQSMTTSEFFALTRATFEQVPGVHNVMIDLADEDDDQVRLVPDDELDSDYVRPHFGLVSTRFDLILPRARQEQLAGRRGPLGRAQEFRVHLTYGWVTPVSCIEVLDVVDSDAFGESRFVRVYMEEEFRRLATGLEY
jgi:hypothetical protein